MVCNQRHSNSSESDNELTRMKALKAPSSQRRKKTFSFYAKDITEINNSNDAMFLIKRLPLLILIVLTSMMSSCIKEDLIECVSGLRLKFHFTLHNNGGNKFGDEVNKVRVYMFDENGLLQIKAESDAQTLTYSYLQDGNVKTISKPNLFGSLSNDYVMYLDMIPPGKYKIVTWGGSEERTESTFFEAHMNDPATHDYKEGVILGVTKMEDFRMFIKYNLSPDIPEDVVPIVPEIDDLWYGAYGVRDKTTSKYTMDDIVVESGEMTDATIELLKNTNLLKVSITGFDYILSSRGATNSSLNVWATAINGRYKIDNSIGENARSIRYSPYFEQIDTDKMLVDIKIMRIDLERHTAQPMYLTIENPLTGQKFPDKPIDIVNTLMQAKDALGNYIYNAQSDFDREYEHPIEIKIEFDLTIRIFVRGWEIIPVVPEV